MSLIKRTGDKPKATVSSLFDKLRTVDLDAVQGRTLTLILDRSGSMVGEPIQQLNAAVQSVVASHASQVDIQAIPFPPGTDAPVPAIGMNPMRGGGSTPMAEALLTFRASLNEGSHAILMSDGQPNNERSVRDEVEQLIGRATIHTVACGDGANVELLRWIAEVTGGNFYLATRPIDLPVAFAQLARKAVAALTEGASIEKARRRT